MQVFTLPDIVSHGPAVTQVLTSDATLKARWILFTAHGTISGPLYTQAVVASISSVEDASHGAHLQDDVPVLYPPNPNDPNDFYQLSSLQAYVSPLWTLTITYGL